MSQWNWNRGLENYFTYLTKTLELTPSSFDKRYKHRSYAGIEIGKLTEYLQNGELNTGDIIRIKGIYSEFVPILNISLLFPKYVPLNPGSMMHLQSPLLDVPEFSLPLRLKPIMGIGLAGLFNKNCKGVYDMCVPIFYNDILFKLQKGITGYDVEVSAKIVNIPERWSRLFVNHQIFKYNLEGRELYAGLLVQNVEKHERINKFFADFWRLDYFPIESYDEDCFEFYQIEPAKGWPSASKYMANYIPPLQFEGFRQKQISSFGILPKINLVDSKVVSAKRKQLRNFYLYAYKLSQSSHRYSIPIASAGHGLFDPSNLKKAVTVFQYDQVNPALSQRFSFKDVE